MEIVGYFCSVLIGASLGLVGSGGSILMIPVFVYIFNISAEISTSYSLLIVGISSLLGAYFKINKKIADIKTAVIFSIPSLISVVITRKWILPKIPENINILTISFTKNTFLMVLLSIIMIFASISMLRHKSNELEIEHKRNYLMIILEGLVIGVLTGMVGAGGGFLIIPALVLYGNIPMKIAVGTSLIIITIKSLTGFLADLSVGFKGNWNFLLIFGGFNIIGIFLGNYLSNYISGKKLKFGFGLLVLFIAFVILFKEFGLNFNN